MNATVSVKMPQIAPVDKRRVYVAGPMSGLPDANYPAFMAAAQHLRGLGFDVFNPAENGLPADAPWVDHMRVDISMLMQCDAVYMLDGWASSKGARLERTIALSLGFTIWQQGAL